MLKYLLAILFQLIGSFCFSQTESLIHVYSLEIPFRPATVQLITDTSSLFHIVARNDGRIILKGVPAGNYMILVTAESQKPEIKGKVLLREKEDVILDIEIAGPCLYDHPASYVPTCPRNHKDSIIPILYGLIGTRVHKYSVNKKEIEVKYGGCVVTDCDPQYYCKLHDLEF